MSSLQSLLSCLAVVLLSSAPAAAAASMGQGFQSKSTAQAPPDSKPPTVPADTSVVTLPSGLSYCVLAGPDDAAGVRKLRVGDHVSLHYNVWLADGKLVDSTYQRGDPFKTWVGKSIEGWNQALPLMSAGSRWKLKLPPELAYGSQGAQPGVPPNASLIFELEVLDAIPLPEFHPARPEHTKTTASGLKYEILRPGRSPQPLPEDRIVVIDYGLWTTDGTLLDSAARNGLCYEVKPGKISLDLDLPFLKEAVSLLRLGSRVRLEVPPEQCFGARANPGLPANSMTIWELEALRVISPMPLPEFVLPAGDQCRRTNSGLLYEVLREGTGPKPVPGGKVRAQYATWLVTGTVFDASFDRGVPARLDLSDRGLLPGIKEALLLMSEGTILRCILPPELGYGSAGWPPRIGPNATLVVYLELIEAR